MSRGLPETYSEQEVADRLRFRTLRAFRDFLSKHDIPYRKAGRNKVFDRAAVLAVMRAMDGSAESKRSLEREIKAEATMAVALDLLEATKRNRRGYVYFVRCGDLVKIGFALNDVHQRIKVLQTGAPQKLVLMHHEPAGEAEERELHRRFAHMRKNGEWFSLEPELVNFISGRARA